MKTVFTYGGHNLFNPSVPNLITVEQAESKEALFRVSYGLDVRDRLTYARACEALGASILHHLSCESIVNNQGR